MSVRSLATRYTDVPLSGSFQTNTAQLYTSMWEEEVKVQSRHMLSKDSTSANLRFARLWTAWRLLSANSASFVLPLVAIFAYRCGISTLIALLFARCGWYRGNGVPSLEVAACVCRLDLLDLA